MCQRLLDENRDGVVVQNIAFVIDYAVLTVAGIRVQGYVTDDAELRYRVFQCTNGSRNQSIRVVRFTPVRALLPGLDCREQSNCRDSGAGEYFSMFEDLIDAETVNTGHGRNRDLLAFAFCYEYRADQVGGGDPRLLHQAA